MEPSGPILKLFLERSVCAPQYLSAGTLILPKLILNGVFFAYVNGYSISKSNASNYRDPAFKEFLSLTEGSEFTIGSAIQGHKITGNIGCDIPCLIYDIY